MGEEKDLLSSLLLELRRGTLTISVLSQMKEPKYGYSLVQSLEEKALPLTPTPYILSFADLRIRGFWKAGGKPVAQNRENIISGQNTEQKFMRS